MKIDRIAEGKYAQVSLEDGNRIFVSVLNDRVTVSKMFWFFPIKELWDYVFPFYIRTASEAWNSSKEVLQEVLSAITEVKNLEELIIALHNIANETLREWVMEHGESAQVESIDKVGRFALKPMLGQKEYREIEKIVQEYGKVQEEVAQQILAHYPSMHFPESLLPYPKKKIQWALAEAVKYTDDDKMIENIKSCAAFLEGFVPDDEASEKNAKLLDALSNNLKNKKHS